MRQAYPEFQALGAEILVTGPDSPEAFRQHWAREGYPFPGLPDPDHTVAQLYGQQWKLWKLGRLPAAIVIDREGRIMHQHYGDSMRDTVGPNELLQIIAQLK